MSLWRWISKVTARLAGTEEVVAVSPAPTRCVLGPAVEALAQQPRVAGRPVSASLARTIALAAANPAITPAEVAAAVGVTRDYARTLLRRARQRSGLTESAAPASRAGMAPVSHPAPVLSAINLTPRARALHFLANGDTPQQAAAKLGVPVGEVEFISKVERLLGAAV